MLWKADFGSSKLIKKYILENSCFSLNIRIDGSVFMIGDLLAALSQKVFIVLRQTRMH